MKRPAQQISTEERGKAQALRAKATHRYAPDPEMRKVTVNLPAQLLEHDTLGTTELIREALKWYHHKQACEALRQLRGKVKFGIAYQQLKEER